MEHKILPGLLIGFVLNSGWLDRRLDHRGTATLRSIVLTEQPSSSSVPEIDKRFLFGCESTNVSVERSDKNKDANENVDADQVKTGRPAGSEQSIDLFTQREEIDIVFRLSELSHAVVSSPTSSPWDVLSVPNLISKKGATSWYQAR